MSTRKNSIFKGMLLSYFTTMVIFCLFSILFAFTDVCDFYTPVVVRTSTLVSVAIGALTSSKNVSSKGWLNGCIIGILYTLSILALGMVCYKNSCIILKLIKTLFINTMVGIFCGIVGINTACAKK